MWKKWMLVLGGVLLVVWGLCWGQEMTTDEAIRIIKDEGMQPRRAEAQEFLVKSGEAVLPKILEIFNENSEIARINAALVLLGIMERAQKPEEMKPHLLRCFDDGSGAVSYLGLEGLLRLKWEAAELEPILRKAMGADKPLPIAVLAAENAAKYKIKNLVPWVYRAIHSLMPELPRVVAEAKREMTEKMKTAPSRPETGAPPSEPPPDAGPKLGKPPMAPTVPSAGEAGARAEFDPDRASAQDLQKFSRILESEPVVISLRRLGWALEELAGQNFGFAHSSEKDETAVEPAWELGKSVNRAAGWFEKNRANYPPIELSPAKGEKTATESASPKAEKEAPPPPPVKPPPKSSPSAPSGEKGGAPPPPPVRKAP